VPGTLRVVTWNLFHGRDGRRGLGPSRRSTWLRAPVDDGTYLHLNRKLTGLMAQRIAAWGADVCALQEVPTAAIRELMAATRMRAVWTTTGPLLGPAGLRDALAAANPDLWRSHEGNANVLLLGPRAAPVDGTARAVRLNPLGEIAQAALRWRLGAGELVRWLPEPRRAVMLRVAAPGGTEIAVACAHCHNGRDRRVTGLEIARAARALEALADGAPAILAGDMNAWPDDPAIAALSAAGWRGAGPGADLAVDHVLHRGLEAAEAPRRLPHAEREVGVTWRGRSRRVLLSDHDPVVAILRLP
jgi:endonuclease/exonuclease/phosphatase family metal-dependent hydrolase